MPSFLPSHSAIRILILAVCLPWLFHEATLRAASASDGAQGTSADPGQGSAPRGDTICGPRCIAYILAHYRKPSPPLIEIVQELQAPALEDGSTLHDIDVFLRRSGVHTCAMGVSPDATFRWPHPIVVHLKPRESQFGHFAVWLPQSTRSEALLWDGLKGTRRLPAWELARSIDVGVVLTSPGPIRPPADAVVMTTDGLIRRTGWACLLLQCVVIAGLWQHRSEMRTADAPPR